MDDLLQFEEIPNSQMATVPLSLLFSLPETPVSLLPRYIGADTVPALLGYIGVLKLLANLTASGL